MLINATVTNSEYSYELTKKQKPEHIIFLPSSFLAAAAAAVANTETNAIGHSNVSEKIFKNYIGSAKHKHTVSFLLGSSLLGCPCCKRKYVV